MPHLLFTYGTLHLPQVQRAVFGAELPSEPDAVVGHRLTEVQIDAPGVIATSGTAIHPMLEPKLPWWQTPVVKETTGSVVPLRCCRR